jgi:cold shock CspA family protein
MPRSNAVTLIEPATWGTEEPEDRPSEGPSFHYTAIEGSGFKSLEEGEKVTYVVRQGSRRGPQAENISKV